MAAEEPGKREWWRIWWVWAAGLPLIMLIFTALAAEWTSRPEFCRTCHYMEPFYQSWAQSEHNDVNCIQCHYPPDLLGTLKGKVNGLYQVASYLTQAYRRSRPWAEIEDASCMRSDCHDVGILSDTNVVIFKNVAFTHGAHLTEPRRGRELRCTSCHSQIVQGEHMLVTTSTCALCHLSSGGVLEDDDPAQKASSECRLCHTMTEETRPPNHPHIADLDVECQSCHGRVTIGDGDVSLDRCYQCHFEQERLEKIGETERLHVVHITENKIECLNCHSRVQHKTVIAEEVVELDCQGCHPKLHEPQHVLFTGRGAHNVPDMPNAMFERGIQCQSCHVYHKEVEFAAQADLGENVYASDDGCGDCHGRGFTKLVDQWNSFILSRRDQLSGVEERVRSTVGANGFAGDLLDSARVNLEIIKLGHPVHNAVYAKAILDSTYAMITKASRAVDSRARIPAFDTNIGMDVPGECRNCHFAIATINVRAFDEYPFSHDIHAVQQELPCDMCHSNATKHGERIVQKSDCTDCHHNEDNPNQCGVCHESQRMTFGGLAPIVDDPDPSLNIHVDRECVDCHIDDGSVEAAGPSTCDKCHEDYGEFLGEWQSATREYMTNLRELITQVDKTRLTAGQQRSFTAISESVEQIQRDGSWGAHNSMFAEMLIEDAGSRIEELPTK
jgi:nitrate/TMAO reductase-like tetraheme cytochrome c subunit